MPQLVLAQTDLMSEFSEDFKAFAVTFWHSVNLTDGKIRLMPYVDVFKIIVNRELLVEISDTLFHH